MERYVMIKEVGSGGSASVWQALDKKTGEYVAIKILKSKHRYSSRQEIMNLPEIHLQSKAMKHTTVVKLKSVFLKNNSNLCLVFEYMKCDLRHLITKPLLEEQVRSWCCQVLQGLAYIHRCGIIHRDIKPDNLLVSFENNNLKIADFGIAREINSEFPIYEYFGTRSYKAPETLLYATNYNCAIDLWAMGATMAELFVNEPLFRHTDHDFHQIKEICRIIGSPKKGEWDEGFELSKTMNFRFPEDEGGIDFSKLIPSASEDAINLIKLLCSWNPRKRPTAMEALQHPFFGKSVSFPKARAIPPMMLLKKRA